MGNEIKFENIKVNDIVFISKIVTTGFKAGRSFFVASPVERVTPKMFVVDGEMYHKLNGRIAVAGKNTTAYRLGETFNGFTKEVVNDQTSDYMNYIRHVKKVRRCRQLAQDIGYRVNYDTAKVKEIFNKLKEVEALLDDQQTDER